MNMTNINAVHRAIDQVRGNGNQEFTTLNWASTDCVRCGRNNHLVHDYRTNKSTLKCSECKKTCHISKV